MSIRSGIVAVLVIGAALARAYGPKNAYITWTSGDVAREIAPLNVIFFWLLILTAAVVGFTALRRRAKS